jgi:hypothetical protein
MHKLLYIYIHTHTQNFIAKETCQTTSYFTFMLTTITTPDWINPLNAELNPICYLLALLAHHFHHVSRIRVKSLTLRLLMSYIYIYTYIHTYIYMERLFLMFLDHTRRRSTVGRTPLTSDQLVAETST